MQRSACIYAQTQAEIIRALGYAQLASWKILESA